MSSTFTDVDHTSYIAGHWTALLRESIARIERFRAAHPEHPICDVLYADLVGDPAAAVATIYGALGLELAPTTLEAVAAYADRHPRGEFGTHRYDLADFGLDVDRVRAEFVDYTDRYGVPEERRAP